MIIIITRLAVPPRLPAQCKGKISTLCFPVVATPVWKLHRGEILQPDWSPRSDCDLAPFRKRWQLKYFKFRAHEIAGSESYPVSCSHSALLNCRQAGEARIPVAGGFCTRRCGERSCVRTHAAWFIEILSWAVSGWHNHISLAALSRARGFYSLWQISLQFTPQESVELFSSHDSLPLYHCTPRLYTFLHKRLDFFFFS